MIDVVMIGCGGFARRYHVPALLDHAGARIAAIFDPFPGDPVRAIAGEAGAPIVASIEAVPERPGPVLAIVTTPHTLHAAHVAAAMARGWHVLCDKPFVMHADQARALAADAGRRGLVNAVAFNRRFDRGCLRAHRALREGMIGAIAFIETVQLGYERTGWFLDPALGGGGPFTGRASHMADLVPWLVGRRPTAVQGRIRPGPPGRSDHGGFISVRFGALECQMTCIEEGWHMWDEVRLFGDAGMIELRRPLKYPLGWDFRMLTRRGEAMEFLDADPWPGEATRDMLAALTDGTPVACDFRAAVTSVEIIEAAFDSARSGGSWQDLAA